MRCHSFRFNRVFSLLRRRGLDGQAMTSGLVLLDKEMSVQLDMCMRHRGSVAVLDIHWLSQKKACAKTTHLQALELDLPACVPPRLGTRGSSGAALINSRSRQRRARTSMIPRCIHRAWYVCRLLRAWRHIGDSFRVGSHAVCGVRVVRSWR